MGMTVTFHSPGGATIFYYLFVVFCCIVGGGGGAGSWLTTTLAVSDELRFIHIMQVPIFSIPESRVIQYDHITITWTVN